MPWNSKNSAVANSSGALAGIAHAPANLHRKLARCVGFATLAACAGASWADGMTGQGIYPGNPEPNAFKIGDFEPVIRPRMFYKNTDTLSGGEQEAWALGGFAGLRSPWFARSLPVRRRRLCVAEALRPRGQRRHADPSIGPVFDLRPGRSVGRRPRRGTDDRRLPSADRPARSSTRRTPAKFPTPSRRTR